MSGLFDVIRDCNTKEYNNVRRNSNMKCEMPRILEKVG